MRGLDSEVTGLDTRHGALPFLITMYDRGAESPNFWEFDVDPLTRKPAIHRSEFHQILQLIESADELVLQNAKFDVGAIEAAGKYLGIFHERGETTGSYIRLKFPWDRTYDTLYAGHLLRSNQPHDLTSMALEYLNVDIKPYELKLKLAVAEARRLCRSHLPEWRIAKEGLAEMPSAKASVTGFDYWLPKAIVKHAAYNLQFDLLPFHKQQPTVGHVDSCDVRIDRKTKWGNPFVIGKDGDRSEVIRKYAEWIWEGDGSHLLNDLHELYGKVLGCHCSPNLCHGDVLVALCHPWRTVCSEYANVDSVVCVNIAEEQHRIIKERGLWNVYLERLKLLPVVHKTESAGVTVSKPRMQELSSRFVDDANKASFTCAKLSGGKLTELPNGLTNDLKSVITDHFGLKSSKKTTKGSDSIDKFAIDTWLETLDQKLPAYQFVSNLKTFRRRRTALSYLEAYSRYWLPLNPKRGVYILYPSWNPTGTDTLRSSSDKPNAQQCSKQEDANLRYCFGPAPDREWWSLDYQNIELRIPAYECGERAMVELFEKPDEPPFFGSYHLLNASIIYPDLFWPIAEQKDAFKDKYKATWYQWVKNAGFALIYGCMEGTFDRTARKPGAYSLLKSKLKELFKLNDKWISYANRYGYVETIPDIEVDPKRGYPVYCSRSQRGAISPTVPLNYHVQSTACWAMMRAMIKVQAYLDELNRHGSDYRMILNVHDEIVLDFPRKENQGNADKVMHIRDIMASRGDCIGIKLTVGVEYHPLTWAKGEHLLNIAV